MDQERAVLAPRQRTPVGHDSGHASHKDKDRETVNEKERQSATKGKQSETEEKERRKREREAKEDEQGKWGNEGLYHVVELRFRSQLQLGCSFTGVIHEQRSFLTSYSCQRCCTGDSLLVLLSRGC